MKPNYKVRRLVALLLVAIVSLSGVAIDMASRDYDWSSSVTSPEQTSSDTKRDLAQAALDTLQVKGKAPKTGYARAQFGNGWEDYGDCDMRNIILRRDLDQPRVNDVCQVLAGVLHDPYTGETIHFVRGVSTSAAVQIDHVVALSNAWQTGAQQLSKEARQALANDPLNLLAVDGAANQQKSDGDAATWLPSHKAFRCQYIARQIAVKQAYSLWVTSAEKNAIEHVLDGCPAQALPIK